MPRPPKFRLDFPVRYELEALERIERSPELSLAFSFPGADPVDPQRELGMGRSDDSPYVTEG